jgi:PAS domain S-box-containing protein
VATQGAPSLVAAERLRRRKARIIERWLQRAYAHLEAAKSTSPPELVDSLPQVLDRMADTLESDGPDPFLRMKGLAEEHGRHRAMSTAYTLEEVIVEHQLLHDVVVEVVEEDGPLDRDTRDRITHATMAAVRDASCEFAKQRGAATEDQLNQTDTRFRHMVEAVKDYAIFTLDPSGMIKTWNVGCMRMKRFTPEEAIGHHFSMLYPDEGKRRDEPMGHLRTAAIEGRFRGEGVRVRKGGELFLADVSITPIYEAGNVVGFTKVVQDLTERNLLMQERDLSRSDMVRLRAEADYRERFIATLSHELRSPLATAKLAADLIARSPGDGQKVPEWSAKIIDALGRCDRMLSDLLDTSRLHAGEPLALEFAHCDVKAIAESMLDELAGRHGNRFRIEADGDTTGFWSADGLRRVLDNLLSNAIKYGDPSQPVTVRLRRVDDHVLISVHNFGTIIPIEEQQNLFRAFHRTPTAQRSGKPGWGIGLALVKGIAEAHGGVVKAESYPKEGTTFTVDLPVDGAAAAADVPSSSSL